MKNIYEILRNMGIELNEEQKATFDRELSENYKTIAEVDKIRNKLTSTESNYNSLKNDLVKRDTDLAELQAKLKTVGEDATKLKDVQAQLDSLTTTYANAKKDWEKQLDSQRHEFLAREKTNSLKFTSNSAKKAFLADLLIKNLPIENDNLLGFDDYVKAYKENDSGAFVSEESTKDTPPIFSTPANGGSNIPPAGSSFGFNFIGVREKPNN